MEKTARGNDAALFPERGSTLAPAVDANLRDRIRSLLASRNEQNPPKTPCPSPDSNFSRRASEGNRFRHPRLKSGAYKFTSAQGGTQVAHFKGRSSDMGATRFDGPAGQIGNISGDGHERRPSQPSLQSNRKVSDEWRWSNSMSGLNQKAHGNVLGREAPTITSMNRTKSSASKTSPESRLPRFHLRTVPPATDVNKKLRPNPLHVPGSYRSEIDARKDSKSTIASPPLEAQPNALEMDILATPFHSDPTHGHSHQAAVDALKDVAQHDQHQSYHAEINPHSLPPQVNLHSNTIGTRPDQLSAKPFDYQSSSRPVVQPISKFPRLTRDDIVEAPVFVIGDDHDEPLNNVNTVVLQDDQPGQAVYGKMLTGPQISDLLAEMPPIRQSTVVGISKHHSTARAPVVQSSSPLSSSASSLHSIALDRSGGDASPVSPLLPEPKTVPEPRKAAETHDDMETPLIPNTRRSSQVTGRFSSVGRAMSILSDLSTRSGIKPPSLRSSGKHKRSDSISNLTTRPKSQFKDIPRNATPAKEGYKTLTDGSERGRPRESDRTSPSLGSKKNDHGKGFTKGITDLESLVTEALSIAGQAVSRDNNEAKPFSSKSRPDEYKRTRSNDSTSSSEGLSSISRRSDEEENDTTLPYREHGHHQESVVKKEAGYDALFRGQYKHARNGTLPPAQTRHGLKVSNVKEQAPKGAQEDTSTHFLEIPRSVPKSMSTFDGPLHHQSFNTSDWAIIRLPSNPSKLRLEVKPPPPAPQLPPTIRAPIKEQHVFHVRDHGTSEDTITRDHIRDYVNAHQRPPVQTRLSSMRLRSRATQGRLPKPEDLNLPDEPEPKREDYEESDCECVPYIADFETAGLQYHPVFQDAAGDEPRRAPRQGGRGFQPRQDTLTSLRNEEFRKQEVSRQDEAAPQTNTYNLEGRHHFSIREPRGFSLSRSHRRSPIARDWSSTRKRYTATVVCITTAFMGLIIGIYAGEVPAIQYAIADEHHYAILGNVLFFIGLAITTALFYPLPLLHGRKPYTLAALAILLPLLFPQAIAVSRNRSPYVATYRVGLLVPRVVAGLVMGFANINFVTTLLDLYGSSLQSGNPHQETVNENDVRRHGGGMGIWLSIWTWCEIGSIGLGFLIGADIISGLDVSWGFWILIVINAAVLVLNILTPEVRRSAYRRSMAEVRSGGDVSRRVARGEIKMHLASTGPVWWWEEVWWGHVLAFRMLKQPGFALLALYTGWIYGQVVLVMILLGALLSKYYRFHPQYVGLAVGIIPLGALLAVPFEKASLFSRSRHHPQRTDSMTFEKRVTWTSHLVRRAIFMISLPFAGLAYTLASSGRPTNYMVPIIFAGLIGFLSNLAIAECNGIIMETFDTSDLQPGMTGRPRRVLPEEMRKKRTNFSSFPRVTAGFAVAQTFSFAFGAVVTAWGGVIERHVGAQKATGVMAGVLLVLTILLIAALFRFKTVQIIPSERFGTNILSGPEDEWKPVIIGNPSGTTRRVSLLEMGDLSRWSEIRRRNKLAPER